MKKVVVGIVSAAALATIGMAAASNSMAASSTNTNAAGVFISGNLGYGYVDNKGNEYNLSLTNIKRSGFAWNGNLGYQFNKYFAVEAGYTHFGQVKANFVGSDFTSTVAGFGLDAKGILPVSKQFDLFAKAGAVDMKQSFAIKPAAINGDELKGSAWTPELGVGAAYNVNKHVALTVQDIYAFKASYNATVSGTPNKLHIPAANAVLAGISYKF